MTYFPDGILQWEYKDIVFASIGGCLMKHIRSCQLCGQDHSLMYPLMLCDGNVLILCQECLHLGGAFQGCRKVIAKYFNP